MIAIVAVVGQCRCRARGVADRWCEADDIGSTDQVAKAIETTCTGGRRTDHCPII